MKKLSRVFLILLCCFVFHCKLNLFASSIVLNTDSLIRATNLKAEKAYKIGNYEDAISYLTDALELRKKYNPEKNLNIIANYLNICYSLMYTWNYEAAIDYAFITRDLFTELDKETEYYGRVLMFLSVLYNRMGDMEKALQYYNSSKRIFDKLNNEYIDHIVVSNIFNKLGDIQNERKSSSQLFLC